MRVAFFLVAVSVFLVAAAPAQAMSVTDENTLERALVKRVNAVRKNHGLRPLRVVGRLAESSDRHARSMAARAYFRHELFTPKRDPDWTSFGTWIRWYYPGPAYRSWSAGENLAWGAPDITSRQTVKRWLASPGHRANLLARSWRHLGVAALHLRNPSGYYGSWNHVTVVVANFGRRS